MSILQGVNIMLEGLGVARATALDTGTTSLVGEAETILHDESQAVQAEEWYTPAVELYEYKIPTVTIPISGGSGNFVFDETITETTSGATGQYKYSGGSIYIVPVTGTFTGGETLTGSTSGATRTGSTLATATTAKLYVSPVWTNVVPSPDREVLKVVKRGDQLYDGTNQTTDFSSPVWLDVIRELYFTDLPFPLASYVSFKAAMRYQDYKKRGRVDNALLNQKMVHWRRIAMREDDALRRTNVLETAEAKRVKGNRTQYYGMNYP